MMESSTTGTVLAGYAADDSAAITDFKSAEILQSMFPDASLMRCEVPEWVHLNEGDRIVARRDGEYPKAGRIDIISEDAYVFWVFLDNGEGRIMVSSQEDVSVWRFPAWMA